MLLLLFVFLKVFSYFLTGCSQVPFLSFFLCCVHRRLIRQSIINDRPEIFFFFFIRKPFHSMSNAARLLKLHSRPDRWSVVHITNSVQSEFGHNAEILWSTAKRNKKKKKVFTKPTMCGIYVNCVFRVYVTINILLLFIFCAVTDMSHPVSWISHPIHIPSAKLWTMWAV